MLFARMTAAEARALAGMMAEAFQAAQDAASRFVAGDAFDTWCEAMIAGGVLS